jgi:chemotaxis response regulator CheB
MRADARPPFALPDAPPEYAVALSASGDGLKALAAILSGLPADFPAALVVVRHLPADPTGDLAEILAGSTALRVERAGEGRRLVPGCVFVALPDRHVLVNADRTLSLSDAHEGRHSRPRPTRCSFPSPRLSGRRLSRWCWPAAAPTARGASARSRRRAAWS